MKMMRDRTTSVKSDGTNVLFDLWLVSRAATDVLDTALTSAGLTADEFGIYSVLTAAETMTPSELARWMSAPPTTVSSYVKRFEARGHVERRRNPRDGRSFVLRLTPAGRRAHAAAGMMFLPVLEGVNGKLGARTPAVRRALASLRDALSH
jgi:DNA-binding MarR family transcriptional regulator